MPDEQATAENGHGKDAVWRRDIQTKQEDETPKVCLGGDQYLPFKMAAQIQWRKKRYRKRRPGKFCFFHFMKSIQRNNHR